MEKRVLLAISLSFVVLFAYQMLAPKPKTPPRPAVAGKTTPGAAANATVGQSGPPSPSTTAAGTALEADKPASAVAAADTNARVADTAERDIIVETNHVHAVFSNRGALVKSWTLKDYLDEKGKPIDMTPPVTDGPATRPFAISVPDEKVTQTLQHALYKPSADSLQVGTGTQSLTFTYEDANGLSAKKTFEFQPGGKPYLVKLTTTVTQGGQPQKVTVHGGAGLGDLERSVKPGGFFHPSNYQQPEAIFQIGKDVTRTPYAKVPTQPVHEGAYTYVGVDDHYFIGMLIARGAQTRVEYATSEVPTPTGPRDVVDYRVQMNGGAAGQAYEFFYGPKDFDVLHSTDPTLELVRSIYFGMFSFLAVPLLRALKWINGYVGNFGWSIILLTIAINLVLFPLRHKSVVSMRKMQEIQPEVKAIQDRYANLKMTDPAKQKMNTELMSLYRERGVNPASGCVPMLLTFPVLFAFYSMLSVAIELRGAPFVGWIHDLSSHDPLFITPVLMGITQFVQTKMTPTTADPVQQKMMMFMPLVLMSFFIWAPSGLVLYWTTSNLWAIGQQALTNKLIGPAKVRSVRPPAERRMKTAGSSRTDQAVKERK
jgi:YidC/Oxa1 family membrane protein insertase